MCDNCPAGTWSHESAATAQSICTSCPTHSDSAAGSASQDDCICDPGYSGGDGGPCQACDAGTFKTSKGTSACTKCPADTFSESSAASSPSTCLDCPAHSQAAAGSDTESDCRCKAGYSGPDGGPCEICTAGSYKEAVGSAACSSCPVDTFLASEGAVSRGACTACPANSHAPAGSTDSWNCKCDAGYTGPDGGMCRVCAAGTYKMEEIGRAHV